LKIKQLEELLKLKRLEETLVLDHLLAHEEAQTMNNHHYLLQYLLQYFEIPLRE